MKDNRSFEEEIVLTLFTLQTDRLDLRGLDLGKSDIIYLPA